MLIVRLLGEFHVDYRGVPVQIQSRPFRSLFAFLVSTAGVQHPRKHVAKQIWPELDRVAAREQLRQGLRAIRVAWKAAGVDQEVDYFIADKINVTFDARASYSLDVHVLEQMHRRANPSTADLWYATSLYAGEFLPGFERDDDTDHTDWVPQRRIYLQSIFDALMTRLTARLRDEGGWHDLIQACQNWALYTEDIEPAYREMMIAHYALGSMTSAWTAYDQCVTILQKNFDAEPSDETELLLKELADGKFVLNAKTNSHTFALYTTSTPALPPTNVPIVTTPIVGREAAARDIAQLLAQPACRLLTVMGPGGIGKTRLAIEVATQRGQAAGERYTDGVFLAPLQNVTSAEELVVAMSDAVRLPTYGQEAPRGQLLNFLREKHMLIVLDNFEQLLQESVDGAGVVAEIIAAAPSISLLVTSRERLHLDPDEHILELDGLDYPDVERGEVGMASDFNNGDPSPLANRASDSYASVQLFLQAARRIYSRFDFATENKGVTRICRLTQGMPLAIEL